MFKRYKEAEAEASQCRFLFLESSSNWNGRLKETHINTKRFGISLRACGISSVTIVLQTFCCQNLLLSCQDLAHQDRTFFNLRAPKPEIYIHFLLFIFC